MIKTDKTPKELMSEIFHSVNGGMKWAKEWAEICSKLSPTPKNIMNQYKALAEMDNQENA